jgi:RND family efflux transporter MFP subunit
MSKRMTAVGMGVLAGSALVGTAVLQARSASVHAGASLPGSPAPSGEGAAAPGGIAAEGRLVAYPGAEVKVGAERAGRLLRVRVEEGSLVRRGELLAEIDSAELRAALAEAKAGVAVAEAEARLAEANLARKQRLVQERILSASELDQATRDVETARARVDNARATVARYEAQLAKSRICSPISGTVIAREVDAGQMVEAGDHAFTVADLGRLRIEGEAHEADAGAVRLGAAVRVTADGYPGRSWKGRVEEIPGAVTLRRLKPQDPSRPTDARVLAVKVALAEPVPLKLGTTVDLRIAPKER